ncbi:uncharacterized protein LOC116615314 [Nematostella vectensis]|uniref:uncharacterized protein LOC125559823 n=1 Tax=Nematostella vectensis TaxID=45351 RepID=UPI00207705C0|nr:uncharacterized protein LOC125559823 [Nematostella vectensis]XP_048588499.1 uncharacterized protein LOC116615314 [Nematostella vectensis]
MTNQPTTQVTITTEIEDEEEEISEGSHYLTSRSARNMNALSEAFRDHVGAVGDFMTGRLCRIAGQVEEAERESTRLRELCNDHEAEISSLNSKVYGLEREVLEEQSTSNAKDLEIANLNYQVSVLEGREETLRMEYDLLRMQVDYGDLKDTCEKGTQVSHPASNAKDLEIANLNHQVSALEEREKTLRTEYNLLRVRYTDLMGQASQPNEDPRDADQPNSNYELGYSAAVRTYQPMLLELDAQVHKFMGSNMREKSQRNQLLKKLKRIRNRYKDNTRKRRNVDQHQETE